MDELQELARLRADVAEPRAEVLSSARARLRDRMAEPIGLHRTRPVRRRMMLSLATAAVVATGAAVLSIARHDGADRPVANPSAPVTRAAPMRLAADYLAQAAARAARTDDPTPGPGQFLRVATHQWGISENVFAERQVWLLTENRSQEWIPADPSGTWYWNNASAVGHRFLSDSDAAYIKANHPELITPSVSVASGKNGRAGNLLDTTDQAVCVSTGPGNGCRITPAGWDAPTPRWLAGLPRDPAALRASLYATATANAAAIAAAHKVSDADNEAFSMIAGVLELGYAPGDLRAALYQVATTIPGIELVSSTANLDGRQGVAIGRLDTLGDLRRDIIFDAAGGQFIGEREVVVDAKWEHDNGSTSASGPVPTTVVPVGTVISSTAVTVDVADAPDPSY